jgi:hypothetical protein
MTDKLICTATKKDGSPCTVPVIKGTDKCFAHSKSKADYRKAQAGQARQRRQKKLNPLDAFRDATFAKVIDSVGKCFAGVPLDSQQSVRLYNGPREVTAEGTYVGLMLLLVLTAPHATPSEARDALEAAVPITMRPPYMPPPEDVYRAGRAKWRQASLLYHEATGLIVLPYPEHLYAGWESVDQVNENEPLPTFDGWTVESPHGDEVIVRREMSFASA